MKEVNYDKDIRALFVILIALVFMLGYFTFIKITYKVPASENNGNDNGSEVENTNSNFNVNFIKNVDEMNSENYLISPYSVEVALNMLKEGASGSSLEEIEAVVGSRSISNFSVKDRIGVANALFIKDKFSDKIVTDFSEGLKNKYGAEIIYDEFSTPDKINAWCNEKTWNMINNLIDELGEEFVLGLANALAIDVDWESNFECSDTVSSEFVNSENTMNVEMMNNTYKNNAQYFENDSSKGVIIPYKTYDSEGNAAESGTKLEFVGILPNDDVKTYISNISADSLSNFGEIKEASNDVNIHLSLPRFSYDYDLKQFQSILETMGIKSVFDKETADLTGMMSKEDMTSLDIENLYVSNAIHKTHIELNEKGTKAAAVTSFAVEGYNAVEKEPEIIDIQFNKPFIYLIRDSETGEILFFGTVYKPNEWTASTCSSE